MRRASTVWGLRCSISLGAVTSLLGCPPDDAVGSAKKNDAEAAALADLGDASMADLANERADGGSVAEPETCGYFVTVRSGCIGDSSHRTNSYDVKCIEGIDYDACRSNVPVDMDRDDDTCFRTEQHRFWWFRGDCDDWDAYWADQVQCLIDDHCSGWPDSDGCIDQVCMCAGEICDTSVSAPGVTHGDGGVSTDGGVVVGGPGGETVDPDAGVVTGGGDGTDPDAGLVTSGPGTAPDDAGQGPATSSDAGGITGPGPGTMTDAGGSTGPGPGTMTDAGSMLPSPPARVDVRLHE